MTKYSFLNDYSEGCHPNILRALEVSNFKQVTPYGEDLYSAQAKSLIRDMIGNPNAGVFLVHGGTMANLLIAASQLRSHEAIIAAQTGHIAVHETGAIEATGHKVITVHSDTGKLTPETIAMAVETNSHAPHMPKPKMVYISNATEVGTVYTKAELIAVSKACKDHGLLLQLDGARLGTALTSPLTDLTFKDIAELTDIFWIGATKVGALIGEAIVISDPDLARDFSYIIKQHGGLLAKGRLLGVQFTELLRDGLYFDLARHANAMAAKLSIGITEAGFPFLSPTESNQVFPILPNALIETLLKNFEFYVWAKSDDMHSAVRLVTSWATPETQVDNFLATLQQAK